jgi:hypothetical protein
MGFESTASGNDFHPSHDAEFLAAASGQAPRPLPINASDLDIEDRADHLNRVLEATSIYSAAVLSDLAQSVPGGLDLRQIDALLTDLASEVRGTFQHAIERIAAGRRHG